MNKIYIRGNEIATKEYVDSLSFEGGGADLSNYYTKEEINNIISETNNSIQVEEMPEASEENVGTIVQYVGITNENYTTSNFYQVVEQTIVNEDGSETTVYIWEEISTPEINLDDYATKKYVDDSLANLDISNDDSNNGLYILNLPNTIINGSKFSVSDATDKQSVIDFMEYCNNNDIQQPSIKIRTKVSNNDYTMLTTIMHTQHRINSGNVWFYG